jgi:hypothetical protein
MTGFPWPKIGTKAETGAGINAWPSEHFGCNLFLVAYESPRRRGPDFKRSFRFGMGERVARRRAVSELPKALRELESAR